ncbi:hypothetical protein MBM_00057 [Drepanopeziza brunnea f. sp. 'multigermtubi' MB_m1]|uniref:Uncharacterized protein n=1 Tax=Marssonina brunnea f. sp. multigermtubi (strain MB_m1) TaxID=1072389 RepID=K1Y6W2_MARBU|nr:uncharacterized protein MBM_00057 [Drepanopeziza brunnea f. sp. 'multigermtubi' MB_m1]EKD20944.1 hypothetical protein MBM_00057 [Drepanopeziza brunnea f. sp. 'multigermtubi' MB_m1]
MLLKQNPFFALAITVATAAAAAAAILRTLTSEASPLFLNLLIKRLLMLTTVKALKYIKCINTLYAVSGMLKVAIATVPLLLPLLTPLSITSVRRGLRDAMRQQLALDTAFLKSAANSPGGLASKSKGFKSSPGSFTSFALAFKTFNLNVAFVRLNSLVVANRSPMTQSASSILSFPFALAAFIAFVAFAILVAFAAPVALVALIIVALFALIVALAALATAPAIAMTLAKRRAKHMRAIKAFRLTRERLVNLKA